jgi:hypothetical protein
VRFIYVEIVLAAALHEMYRHPLPDEFSLSRIKIAAGGSQMFGEDCQTVGHEYIDIRRCPHVPM